MKEILKNRMVVLLLTVAMVIGGIIGGMLKPSNPQAEQPTSHQHEQASEGVWTCSMHPQIRQSEEGQCPICGMDLIPVSSDPSADNDNSMVYKMRPEAVAMANIQTTRVGTAASGRKISLTGKIQPDEQRMASVVVNFPGRIERLFINFTGQLVEEGDKIATLYSPELLTAQKELLEAAGFNNNYPELYKAAREKLRLLKLTEKQINEIEKTGQIKEQFEVFADKEGVVVQRNVAVGDYVGTGAVLFNVVDLSRVWVMLDAYETDLPFIKLGDEVSFTAAGISGRSFTAKVDYIDPLINLDTRTASVRVQVSNPHGALKPGTFVNAQVVTSIDTSQSSLEIPRTALLWSGKRSVVYVKVPGAHSLSFEMREVTIGSRSADMYSIEAGLDLGEEVVTNGAFAIDAAAQLDGNYSMMARPESKALDIPQAFQEQVTAVAGAYFEIKTALANDDQDAAHEALDHSILLLSKVEMQQLSGETLRQWTDFKKRLSDRMEIMSKENKLESLRKHFALLSGNILGMTESFSLADEKMHKNFCPMAFDNKGAFWLSETEGIQNPYFGEAMLECGEVTETYRNGKWGGGNRHPSPDSSSGGHAH